MKKPAITIVLLCASLCVFAQNNEIYKWVDADGNVHYEDRPDGVSNAPVEIVEIASSRTSPERVQAGVDARLERQEAREEAKELEEEARQEAAEAQAERDAQREQCAAYRSRLEKFNTARRLYRTDENGERIYLDEGQMAETRTDLQARIRESCSGF